MANRTNPDLVVEILAPGHDYDTLENPPLAPFIRAANLRVSWCVTNAANYGRTAMDTATAKEVEGWLAAGLYKLSDQQLKGSTAGRSSGQFRGTDGQKFSEQNQYLRGACAMDSSMMLAAALDGRLAGASWLGKVVDDQIPYDQRTGEVANT